MTKLLTILLLSSFFGSVDAAPSADFPVNAADLNIRDPFVYADGPRGRYLLVSSIFARPGEKDGSFRKTVKGVMAYQSKDLVHFSEPQPILTLDPALGCTAVWAPELHAWRGKWYLFATLSFAPGTAPIQPMLAPGTKPGALNPRGTWVFVADDPLGPYRPVRNGSVTPKDWMCLDGTLFADNGKPYMVFCHEWCQTGDGRMMLAELTDDLSSIVGEPKELFRASSAGTGGNVTDGPFLYRSPKSGRLFMPWSNFGKDGYAVYLKESVSGRVEGPWKNAGTIFSKDGGHSMLFRTLNGSLTLALHQPNHPGGAERMRIFPIEDDGATLRLAAAARVAGAYTPYGVCSHVSRWGYPYRDESCKWISLTGLGRVRSDFDWSNCQKRKDGPFDFTMFDNVQASAAARGLTLLPILYGIPKWAEPADEHLPAFDRYIYEFVSHFRGQMPEVEIWNEENIGVFWKNPNPEKYLKVLSTAYAAAKRADPNVTVFFGGTAGVPLPFIRKVYESGGAKSFDVMNVHPYSQPYAPEGKLDAQLEELRALMAKFGDAKKDVVITEHGWPTHDPRVDGKLLRTALALARPEKKAWNVVYATTMPDSGSLNAALAVALEAALPSGARVQVCAGAALRARLKAGDVDAVIYPFDETYPSDTVDEVIAFVKAGGTLIDFGGMPMWFPVAEPKPGEFKPLPENSRSGDRRRLKIAEAAYWTDSRLPEKTNCFPTDAAKAAGYAGNPAGEKVSRFQTAAALAPGDEFVPILTAKDKTGGTAVAASLVRFNSDFKGRLVVSGVRSPGGAIDEATQARYLVRAMGIAFAEGVRAYYWYEFRASEVDPTYSENNFGLTHADFLPKPAWGAYANFIRRRPAGSVQRPGAWHDATRTTFFPQWTRPDGVSAGLLWKTGKNEICSCRFDGDDVSFVTETGRAVKPAHPSKGVYLLVLGERPLFFTGAAFVGLN